MTSLDHSIRIMYYNILGSLSPPSPSLIYVLFFWCDCSSLLSVLTTAYFYHISASFFVTHTLLEIIACPAF